MFKAYEIASQWRPHKRGDSLGNVVKTAFADAHSAGGYVVSSDFGEDRIRHFNIDSGHVSEVSNIDSPVEPVNVRSPLAPDGLHRIALREHNLWLINIASDRESQLTFDGSADNPYGRGHQQRPSKEIVEQPVCLWSQDGRYTVSQRLNLRDVTTTYITESAPRDGGLPKIHPVVGAFPGDERVPEVEILIIDTHAGTIIQTDLAPIAATHTSPLLRRDFWWSESTGKLYLLHSTRDWLQLSLIEIDPGTGSSRTLIHEKATRRIRPNLMFHQEPNVAVNDEGSSVSEVIWLSERDGWGHLYLYDASTGACKHQITRGPWLVSRLLRVDWATRTLWASIAGLIDEDVYRETICKIHIGTGELTRITDDHYDHRIVMMPDSPTSHPWFVDAASTVSEPTRYTVRSWDGAIMADLGAIDCSRLQVGGWRPPERFRVKAADGVTNIFGTIFFPPNFDDSATYPVIDHVYPGPQTHRSVPYFSNDEVEPFAALGMIGITVDGRGTPMRERSFFDESWRNVGSGPGLHDHVTAIRKLAKTRGWMDADNVAIFGHSAGGFAAARAMELFPDFFKVGVAAAGRFEGRLVMAMIMEMYDDPYDTQSWKRASAVEAAGDITGKFLIVHGETDVSCTIHHAYRLVDRMIEANRDFDLLVIPGDDHDFSHRRGYVERRIWDYFTKHTLRADPPRGFLLEN